MGQQQREEERGEDPQVWPPALGIETAVPRLRSATAQHHHRCPWGWSREMDTTLHKMHYVALRNEPETRRTDKRQLSDNKFHFYFCCIKFSFQGVANQIYHHHFPIFKLSLLLIHDSDE